MHRFRPFLISLALVSLLGLTACWSFGFHRKQPDLRMSMAIEGTWKGDQSGAVLSVFGDGRLILENAPGMQPGQFIKGKIERGFDQLLITYLQPAEPCGTATGLYRFVSDGKKLSLEIIREDCPARASQLEKSWTIKERTPTPLNKDAK